MFTRTRSFGLTLLVTAMLLAACGGFSTPIASPGGPWYADPAGDDTNDCLSPGTPCASIQAAVDKADAGGTVIAAAGTYNENVIINKALVLQGAGMNDTIINANGSGRALAASFAAIEIQRLTMRNGSTNSVGGNFSNIGAEIIMTEVLIELGASGYGGGIYNGGKLDLISVEVVGNSADRGAGIYNAVNAEIIANDLLIESNPSTQSGAGVFNDGEFTASNTQFINNTADGEGGGIFNDQNGSVNITDALFSGNGAVGGYSGGGFFNRGVMDIVDSTLIQNVSSFNGGGGHNRGMLNLVNTSFQQNAADVFGGGLYHTFDDSLNISGGEFVDNQAMDGGGLFARANSNIVDTTFEANEASSGGGIFNESSEMQLTNVEITNNFASNMNEAGGAGLLNMGQFNTVVVTNSLIEGNMTASGGAAKGGGIYSRTSQLVVAGTTVRDNFATAGGGIAVDAGTFELHNSTVEDNHASLRGGALLIMADDPCCQTGLFIVRQSTISENTSDGDGGGIYNRYADLTIDDSTIKANSAAGNGGGLYLHRAGIYRVTVSGNTANAAGGGLWVGTGQTVEMQNSTISNNSADSGGGAYLQFGDLYLRYVTMAENQTSNGTALAVTGISTSGLARIQSSILADNSGPNCGGGIIDSLAANVSDDGSCNFNEPTDQQNTNPNLGALQNNGGLTETHALPAGSPAIDADSCHSNNLDQRKEPRPAGANCDSGAFEHQQGLVIATVQSPDLCEAAGNLNQASFRSVSLREGQGLLVVLDVPGGPPDGEFPALLNGMELICRSDSGFPDRLFCVGPELPGGGLGRFELYTPTCPQPIIETEISIPARPTAAPTVTVTPRVTPTRPPGASE